MEKRQSFKTKYKRLLVLAAAMFAALMLCAVPASAKEGEPKTYTVQPGDNLYRIALNQLGDGRLWDVIYSLNAESLRNSLSIHPGQVLQMPDAEQAEAVHVAVKHCRRAAAVEPSITAMMQTLESDKAHLAGLQFRLKSPDSLARKILLDMHDMEVSADEAADSINDVIRYTLVIDDAYYTAVTKETLDRLNANGQKVFRVKNFWADDSRAYQGINTCFKSPDGTVVELQFHTPDSYDTKELKTHKYYEIIRDENASPKARKEAEKKLGALFAKVPIPKGAKSFVYATPEEAN